ncbi:hypothetical protein IC229_08945 [Spirosoma sp. BT702]|uniref:Uncharacterized protein n=1 Tax=Spirosoma profusum TaxID=2771354 RepID=A0A926XUX8_9BACT|nr:hypothetical protein [Spirosoma profusum]MBD2700762.1 hypothetical protein [Spirosoma profusum]
MEPQDIDAANQANNTTFTLEFRVDSPKKVPIHISNATANTFWGFGAVNFPGCGPAAGEIYTCRGITIRLPVGSRSGEVDPALPATVEWTGSDTPQGSINFTLNIGDGTFSRNYIVKFVQSGEPAPPPPPPPPFSIDPVQSTVVGGRIVNGRLPVLVILVAPDGKAVTGAASAFKVVSSTVRLNGVTENQNGEYTLILRGNFDRFGRIECSDVLLFGGIFKTLDPGPHPR